MPDFYRQKVYHDPDNKTLLPPWDFKEFAGDKAIVSYDVIVPAPLTCVRQEMIDGVVAVMISGGNLGESYEVTARVVIETGESVDNSYCVLCVEK